MFEGGTTAGMRPRLIDYGHSCAEGLLAAGHVLDESQLMDIVAAPTLCLEIGSREHAQTTPGHDIYPAGIGCFDIDQLRHPT